MIIGATSLVADSSESVAASVQPLSGCAAVDSVKFDEFAKLSGVKFIPDYGGRIINDLQQAAVFGTSISHGAGVKKILT